jgi:hypothetical protein
VEVEYDNLDQEEMVEMTDEESLPVFAVKNNLELLQTKIAQ